ncbi:flavohemoprotein [Minicystis rosea]|nr:flavohemoprotein [Minicystis rosea]
MDNDLQTIRDSFRRLIPRADLLAQRFYDTLFTRQPETRALFEGVLFEDQKRRLVRALALVVRNMERPEFLRPYLHGLGAIHVAYGVRNESYPVFAECLLEALAATAGPSWSRAEEAVWSDAIRLISNAMLAGASKVG